MLKRITILLFAIAIGAVALAQVTSSSLTGNVRATSGELLVGAFDKSYSYSYRYSIYYFIAYRWCL